jgi:hypothetical protein
MPPLSTDYKATFRNQTRRLTVNRLSTDVKAAGHERDQICRMFINVFK